MTMFDVRDTRDTGTSAGTRVRRWLMAATLPLLLGACAWDGETAQTASPLTVPAAWDGPVATTANAAWPSAAWWEGFKSPELSRLLVEAQAGNPDLAAAAARVVQAEAQAEIAGAPLWPTLQTSLSPQISGTRPIGGSSYTQRLANTSASDYSSRSVQAGLSASYEIDFWGKNRARLESAQYSLDSSRFDHETVALTLSSTIADTYFQVLSLRDRLAVARANLDNATRVLDLIQARFDAGAASQLDLAQQKATVATQRANIPGLERQERATVYSLAILVGRPPEGFTVTGQSLMDVAPPAMGAGVPGDLLARRPDVRYAEAQLAAAGADITVARTQLLPSVTLDPTVALEAVGFHYILTNPTLLYSVAGSISQSLFSGGKLEGQIHQAEGRQTELTEAYRKAALAAFSDVETAVSGIDRYEEQYRLQGDAVVETERAYQLAEERYKAGLTDLETLLDAQRALLSTQDTQVQVKLNRVEASVDLFKALGGGWQDDGSSFISQKPLNVAQK